MKKSITLLGMSGVGKTSLSRKLPREKWFHYSGDYRIASHYLRNEIGDFLKAQALKSPILSDLLKSDAIKIRPNVSIDNLSATSAYIGKVGNTSLGGSAINDFKYRQKKHLEAEIAACYDVVYFQKRAKKLYGYDYFLYDAGGSICELNNDDVLAYLAKHTEIVYLHADELLTQTITERALSYPKPLYYDGMFLDNTLSNYLTENQLLTETQIIPNDFIRYVIPKLMIHRAERYLAIAEKYGKVIDANEAYRVSDEDDFFALLDGN